MTVEPFRSPEAGSMQDPEAGQAAPGINVNEIERIASAVGGLALGLYGLSRRSFGGLALAVVGGSLVYRGVSGHCALYDALGVDTAKNTGAKERVPAAFHGVMVQKIVTINRPIGELYQFWRNLENLPRFMQHLESVAITGANTSHWVAKAPLGTSVEWDAEIIKDSENETIGWRSLEGSGVDNAGSVHFSPAEGDLGTEVKVTLKYVPPGGRLGAAVAKLFGESPDEQIEEDLNRFKQLVEQGQDVRPEGQAASCRRIL